MIEVVVPILSSLLGHNCGKKHFGKCLAGTSGCYDCGKNDHTVRDCPAHVAREGM